MDVLQRTELINKAATERAKLLSAALKSNISKAGLVKTGKLYSSVIWKTKINIGGEINVISATAKRHGFVLSVVGRKYTWVGTRKSRKIPERSAKYEWWQGELLRQAEFLGDEIANIDANYMARTSGIISKNTNETA